MAYKGRRRGLTSREREVVAQRRKRREAYARSRGFDSLEDQARYRNSPKLRRYLKRMVLEHDYNSMKDLSTAQRRSAVQFMKYRNWRPRRDDWSNSRFTGYIRELFGDELTDEWIDQYVGHVG